MAILVLTLPSSLQERSIAWVLIQAGDVLSEGEIDSTAPAHFPEHIPIERVIALIPSQAVFVRKMVFPGRSDRDAKRAAPFLIEDHLAEPLDEVSVEIGPILDDGARYVFALNTQLRDAWKILIAGLGIKPVYTLPDAMAIESFGADLAAFKYENSIIFKLAEADFEVSSRETEYDQDVMAKQIILGAVESELAEFILTNIAEQACPRKVLISDGLDPDWVAPNDEAIALKRIPAQDLRINSAGLDEGVLAQLPALLGRHYLSRLDIGALLHPWRNVAILALVAGLSSILIAAGQAIYYDMRTDLYREAQVEAFRQTFPDITRVVNVRAQLRRQIASLGGENQGNYLELSAGLAGVLSQSDNVQLESLRYDSARSALTVTALYNDFSDFEALEQSASDFGILLEDGGARQAELGIVGDFTVSQP